MHRRDATRDGETAVALPPPDDARLRFVGWIETPFATRADCPRQGDPEHGPDCTLHVARAFHPALTGLEAGAALELLYWLHEARRDLLTQSPASDGALRGSFALRSPLRPNPIGLSRVRLVRRAPEGLVVRGLDCLNGTPLLDIKPDRCAWGPPGPTCRRSDS